MQRSELRISGLLQSSIAATVVGAEFHDSPAGAAAPQWPYFVAGYALLAAVVPWLLGGIERSELSLGRSAIFALIFALPLGVSAYSLDSSPYRMIGMAFWLLVGMWAVHFAVSVFMSFKKPRE